MSYMSYTIVRCPLCRVEQTPEPKKVWGKIPVFDHKCKFCLREFMVRIMTKPRGIVYISPPTLKPAET